MPHSQEQMEELDGTTRPAVYQEVSLRRRERTRHLTETTLQQKEEQIEKAKRTFSKAYETFKSQLVSTRGQLRKQLSEDDLYEMLLNVEEACEKVTKAYEGLRQYVSIIEDFTSYQRKVDTATACKQDMVIHLHYRITEIGVQDFDSDAEAKNLKFLKKPYAASVYSAASSSIHHSESKSIRDLAVEAAADLAAKKARMKALEVQERERDQLAQLEAERAQVSKAIETAQRKLKPWKLSKS